MTVSRSLSAVLALAMVVAVACGASAPASGTAASAPAASAAATPLKMLTLKVGVVSVTAPTTAMPLIALSLGVAKKYGLDLQLTLLKPDVAAQALATGEVDVLGTPSIQSAILQGLDARVIAGSSKPYFSLWGRKGTVETWKDLRGRRLGVPAGKGSSGDVLFSSLLEAEGVPVSAVTFSYNSAPTNYQALAAGSVDAALTTPPFTYQLAADGRFVQIDDLAKKEGTSISTEYTMMRATIQRDPAVIERFMDMLLEVQKVLYAKPLDARIVPVIEKYLNENGTDPKSLELAKFYEELAQRNVWQVIPTRELIKGGLAILSQIPSSKDAALKAKFEDIVYVVPSHASEY